MSADSKSTFDSVIVVTDRTVLDENIRYDMNLVQSSKGLVVAVGEKSGAKSPQLKKALVEGDHIITCTLPTGQPHIAMVVPAPGSGRPWIVHNMGYGPRLENRLFDFPITGHYRYLPLP